MRSIVLRYHAISSGASGLSDHDDKKSAVPGLVFDVLLRLVALRSRGFVRLLNRSRSEQDAMTTILLPNAPFHSRPASPWYHRTPNLLRFERASWRSFQDWSHNNTGYLETCCQLPSFRRTFDRGFDDGTYGNKLRYVFSHTAATIDLTFFYDIFRQLIVPR